MIDVKIAKRRYKEHKHNAKKRNVEFLITFQEWYDWWSATGKWDQRGQGSDKYCMCRVNDKGPYAIGNIFCDTYGNNTRMAHKGKKQNRPQWNTGIVVEACIPRKVSCVACKKQTRTNMFERHVRSCEGA